jgi:hypothetical protein
MEKPFCRDKENLIPLLIVSGFIILLIYSTLRTTDPPWGYTVHGGELS